MFGVQARVIAEDSKVVLHARPGRVVSEFELERMELGPTVLVDVGSLLDADSPRSSGENMEHVETLAEVRAELPPIIVHRATMRVIDGMHRLRAAKCRGDEKIAAKFFDGDEASAFVVAVRSNIAHGMPLSLADRKHAAERILVSHPLWSDRMVASVTGIAAGTVAELRKRALRGSTLGNARIGQDGRVHPIDSTVGRRLASELIAENPDMSLRQIARAAGISPETARDVRNRMRRGEDPLPRQRAGRSGSRSDPIGKQQTPFEVRAAAVERLRSDPALRFSEAGRSLLVLLNIHTIGADEWDKIIGNVPPHCGHIVAQLARECAELWAEFASKVECQVTSVI